MQWQIWKKQNKRGCKSVLESVERQQTERDVTPQWKLRTPPLTVSSKPLLSPKSNPLLSSTTARVTFLHLNLHLLIRNVFVLQRILRLQHVKWSNPIIRLLSNEMHLIIPSSFQRMDHQLFFNVGGCAIKRSYRRLKLMITTLTPGPGCQPTLWWLWERWWLRSESPDHQRGIVCVFGRLIWKTPRQCENSHKCHFNTTDWRWSSWWFKKK